MMIKLKKNSVAFLLHEAVEFFDIIMKNKASEDNLQS